jgi:hypothetical protein
VKDDGGFFVLEAASMRILEYSRSGRLLNISTERPDGFVPPAHDLSSDTDPKVPELLKEFTWTLGCTRIGRYLLVAWTVPQDQKRYLELFDKDLQLRLTRVEIPGDLDPLSLYALGNSVFLRRASPACALPGEKNRQQRGRAEEPPVTVELTFDESIVRN